MVAAMDNRLSAPAIQVVAAFAIFWLQVVALQHVSGALSSEYGGAPDEAAHYVTALMVRAFLLGGGSADPMSFVTDYYLYYPKVALGHWPPVQYGALGLWLAVFGATRLAAMAFIALVAAATATTVYLVARREIGPIAGWLAGALFIALPLVQASSGRVMLESLVTLLTLLATLAFAHFVSTNRMLDGLIFALIATAAILTRGSAWSLALLPPLTLLLTRRLDMLRLPAFWISAIPVAVFCLPWYIATLGMSKGSFVGDGFDPDFIMSAAPQFSIAIASALGFALGIPCAIGLWVKVVKPLVRADARTSPVWPALAAMAIVTILFHSLVPAGISARYMVPLMPAAVLFSIAGANALVQRWGRPGRRWLAESLVCSLLVVGFAVETFDLPALKNGGYRASLASVANTDVGREKVVLIVSGPLGEGSIVAAAAEAEDGQFLVLRGSKVLVDQDWMGRDLKNRFSTIEDVLSILEQIPVHVVILDSSVPEHERPAYHELLSQALQSAPSTWGKAATFSVHRAGLDSPHALTVYTRRAWADVARRGQIDISLIRSLMIPSFRRTSGETAR